MQVLKQILTKTSQTKKVIALFIAAIMVLQVLPWNVLSFAQGTMPTHTPTITYSGLPIYEGMTLPYDAQLNADFNFTVYINDFLETTIQLQAPLIPANTGNVSAQIKDQNGNAPIASSIYVTSEGDILLTIDAQQGSFGIMPPKPMPEYDYEEEYEEDYKEYEYKYDDEEIEEPAEEPEPEEEYETEKEQEEEQEEEIEEEVTEDYTTPDTDYYVPTPAVQFIGMEQSLTNPTAYTVSFTLPVMLDPSFISTLELPAQLTIPSGRQPVSVTVVDLLAANMITPFAPTSALLEVVEEVRLYNGANRVVTQAPPAQVAATTFLSLRFDFIRPVVLTNLPEGETPIPIPDGLQLRPDVDTLLPLNLTATIGGSQYPFATVTRAGDGLNITFVDAMDFFNSTSHHGGGIYVLNDYHVYLGNFFVIDVNIPVPAGNPQRVDHTITMPGDGDPIIISVPNPHFNPNLIWAAPSLTHSFVSRTPAAPTPIRNEMIANWLVTYNSGQPIGAAGQTRTIRIEIDSAAGTNHELHGTPTVGDWGGRLNGTINTTTTPGWIYITYVVPASESLPTPLTISYQTALHYSRLPISQDTLAPVNTTLQNRANITHRNANDTADVPTSFTNATHNLTAGNFQQWMAKSGIASPCGRYIDWTIEINTAGETFSSLVLYDRLGADLHLLDLYVNGTSRINDIAWLTGSSNPGGNPNPPSSINWGDTSIPSFEANTNEFRLPLITSSTTSPDYYRITYRTRINEHVFEANREMDISNIPGITFEWPRGGIGPGTGGGPRRPPSVSGPTIDGRFISKEATYFPGTRLIRWDVDVNRLNLGVGVGTLTLTIGEHQQFVGGSFGGGGVGTTFTVPAPFNGVGFHNANTINISISGHDVLQPFFYYTLVTNPQHFAANGGANYRNDAAFSVYGNVLANGNTFPNEVTAFATVNVAHTLLTMGPQPVQNHRHENDELYLYWQFTVNQAGGRTNTYTSQNARVRVNMAPGLVYPVSAFSGSTTFTTHHTPGDSFFYIDLPNNFGAAGNAVVTYRTRVDVDHVRIFQTSGLVEFVNDIVFTHDVVPTSDTVHGDRTVVNGTGVYVSGTHPMQAIRGDILRKTSSLHANEDIIRYTVWINPNRVSLDTLWVSDRISAINGVTLDISSIRLYEATLTGYNAAIANNATWENLPPAWNMSLNPVIVYDTPGGVIDFDEDGFGFSVLLPQDNQAYILVYDVLYDRVALNGQPIRNDVRYGHADDPAGTDTGGGRPYENTSVQPHAPGAAGGGGGGASTMAARLTVNLFDYKRPTMSLDGVSLRLYRVAPNGTHMFISEVITDTDGVAVFNAVPTNANFIIVQSSSHAGYDRTTFQVESYDCNGTGDFFANVEEGNYHALFRLTRDASVNDFRLNLTNYPTRMANDDAITIRNVLKHGGMESLWSLSSLSIRLVGVGANTYVSPTIYLGVDGTTQFFGLPHGEFVIELFWDGLPLNDSDSIPAGFGNITTSRPTVTILPDGTVNLSEPLVITTTRDTNSGFTDLYVRESIAGTGTYVIGSGFTLDEGGGSFINMTTESDGTAQFLLYDGETFTIAETPNTRTGLYVGRERTVEGGYDVSLDWISFPHAASLQVTIQYYNDTPTPLAGTTVNLFSTAEAADANDITSPNFIATLQTTANSVEFDTLALNQDLTSPDWVYNGEPVLEDTNFYIHITPPAGYRLRTGDTHPVTVLFEGGQGISVRTMMQTANIYVETIPPGQLPPPLPPPPPPPPLPPPPPTPQPPLPPAPPSSSPSGGTSRRRPPSPPRINDGERLASLAPLTELAELAELNASANLINGDRYIQGVEKLITEYCVATEADALQLAALQADASQIDTSQIETETMLEYDTPLEYSPTAQHQVLAANANPQTGDEHSPFWLILSAIGLAVSIVTAIVIKTKSRAKRT